jgi:hypothetical protein
MDEIVYFIIGILIGAVAVQQIQINKIHAKLKQSPLAESLDSDPTPNV